MPTCEEMRVGLGLPSKSGVVRLLDGLEERGAIRRLRYRFRGIELVAAPAQGLPIEMRYAGVLKLLEECSPHVPESLREAIESAHADAVATGKFTARRVLDRCEIKVRP